MSLEDSGRFSCNLHNIVCKYHELLSLHSYHILPHTFSLQMAKVQFPDQHAHEEMLARRNDLITAVREVNVNLIFNFIKIIINYVKLYFNSYNDWDREGGCNLQHLKFNENNRQNLPLLIVAPTHPRASYAFSIILRKLLDCKCKKKMGTCSLPKYTR